LSINRWVLWKYEPGKKPGDKPQKVPYQVTGQKASVSDHATWTTFDMADKNRKGYAGLGFMAGEKPGNEWIFVDLDHCLKDGIASPKAQQVVDIANSYTEISPSETGLHIFIKGPMTGAAIKTDFGELYNWGRFFTVTGDLYQGRSELRTIGEAQPV
jgi:putative DNA primase/helicase